MAQGYTVSVEIGTKLHGSQWYLRPRHCPERKEQLRIAKTADDNK